MGLARYKVPRASLIFAQPPIEPIQCCRIEDVERAVVVVDATRRRTFKVIERSPGPGEGSLARAPFYPDSCIRLGTLRSRSAFMACSLNGR